MKKSLQVLLGVILIGVLAYIAFLNTSKSIEHNLISKAEAVYDAEDIRGVKVQLKGNHLTIGRVLILSGIVESDEVKNKAITLVQNIEGVLRVEADIIVKKIPIIVEKKIEIVKETINPAIVTTEQVVPTVKAISEPTSIVKKAITPIESVTAPIVVETIKVPTESLNITVVPKLIKSTVVISTVKAISKPTSIVKKVITPIESVTAPTVVAVPIPINPVEVPTVVGQEENIKTELKGVE